jgi:hypothetical protein
MVNMEMLASWDDQPKLNTNPRNATAQIFLLESTIITS